MRTQEAHTFLSQRFLYGMNWRTALNEAQSLFADVTKMRVAYFDNLPQFFFGLQQRGECGKQFVDED